MATSIDPDARISAGMQKRARNLAAEEILIEVMAYRGRKLYGEAMSEHSGK